MRPVVRRGTRSGFGSRQLAEALEVRQDSEQQARLYIPHYWGIYVHDGRGAFGPKRAKWLIWFRDPKDDPRLSRGRSPRRASQIRHLTPLEFQLGMERNKVDPGFMILRKHVGPVRPSPFFENEPGGGMHRFGRIAGDIIVRDFNAHLKKRLKTVLSIKGSVTVKL